MIGRIESIRWAMLAVPLAALSAAAILPAASARAADDDCLAAPNTQAAAGSHWYYRIDHANNGRKCWHLGQEAETAQRAVKKPQVAAKSGARPVDTAEPRRESSGQAAQGPGDQIGRGSTQGGGPPSPQIATAGNQNDLAGTYSFVPWPDPPRQAPATEHADTGASDAVASESAASDSAASDPVASDPVTPEPSIAPPATKTALQDDAPAPGPQTAAAEVEQSAPVGLAGTLLQSAGAVAAVGVLLFAVFKIPAMRRRRRTEAARRFAHIRLPEDRSQPGFATKGRDHFPRIATEPIAPRTAPRKGLRQILRELENAELCEAASRERSGQRRPGVFID